ncbi:ion channel [Chitinophagaceae bacterium LWZ2-11]
MALLKHINPFSKTNNDTGFGSSASNIGGRFINKDGSYNLKREGIPFWRKLSLYHTMLTMPLWKFMSIIVIFFLSINLIYTCFYFLVGISGLQGIIAVTGWQKFKEVYFFSTETFTTVGYGRINPMGDGVNLIAAFEAMTGFLSFALATGLIYGRFTKPKLHLVFSEHAVIAPYKDKTGLMFRLATYKDHHALTNVEIKVNLALLLQENGTPTFKFYELELERAKVDSLMMNWTVVHPIDEKSPLLGFTYEDIEAADLEVYVLVRGFDDVYSNTVQQRSSYTFREVKFNAKFVPMYREDGDTTVLEMDKLNQYVEASTTAALPKPWE